MKSAVLYVIAMLLLASGLASAWANGYHTADDKWAKREMTRVSQESQAFITESVIASNANTQAITSVAASSVERAKNFHDIKRKYHAPAKPKATSQSSSMPMVAESACQGSGDSLSLSHVRLLNDAFANRPARVGDANFEREGEADSTLSRADAEWKLIDLANQYHGLAERHDALVDVIEKIEQQQETPPDVLTKSQ